VKRQAANGESLSLIKQTMAVRLPALQARGMLVANEIMATRGMRLACAYSFGGRTLGRGGGKMTLHRLLSNISNAARFSI